jgi:predicted N-acetyltransferase YhbS
VRTPLALFGLAKIEQLHPPEPHMYLAVLGTDPGRQGEGIGGRLMAPVLEECDRDGVAAYLESSKERNLAYYSRFGFRVTSELDLPRGPRVWGMWRDPL